MRKPLLLLALAASVCAVAQQRLLGGDISMLPSYEESKAVYRDSEGKAVKPLEIFSQLGWNAMRVRLFVDPGLAPADHKDEGVCQDIGYVKRLGAMIKRAGFRFMLDFHYSDTWADPGKQFMPARWSGVPRTALPDSVYAYTRASLEALVGAGAAPDLIQVGNEISNGMMWPEAKTSPFDDANQQLFGSLLAAGCRACRDVCPEAKIIIHTEKAGDWAFTKAFYDRLATLDYDVIGLSYYPMWHKAVGVLSATLDSLAVRYPDKPVMIVETAAYYSHANDRWAASPDQYAEFYPISIDGQRMFTRELVAELRRHANVTGLFWWFPEENGSCGSMMGNWINRGLFDNRTGRLLPAAYDFMGFIGE